MHTACVAKTIRNQEDNKVPQATAPKVNPSEATLPRKIRTTLSQLRSGSSSTLNSYLHRINTIIHLALDCPRCNLSSHTTTHLFNCPSNPTELETGILWKDPPAVTILLDLLINLGVELDDNY